VLRNSAPAVPKVSAGQHENSKKQRIFASSEKFLSENSVPSA
jgi:hypothetical protein